MVRDDAGMFRHEALLYAGIEDFVERTTAFLRGALEAGEPALVVVSEQKIDRLRRALPGAEDREIRYADMADVGQNPARIIPAWRRFVDDHAGRALRGIGEPIWHGRSADELVECERHEALLNVALADASLWLACPYDTTTLAPVLVAEASRTHPLVWDEDGHRPTSGYPGLDDIAKPFDRMLPEPGGPVAEMGFSGGNLVEVRGFVGAQAAEAGLVSHRVHDLVLAASELATNSVRHGGGDGVVRVWRHGGAIACEVRDAGRLDRPLAGRERPTADQTSGFGLWLANQVCDLVQIRSVASGTVVRLLMSLRDPASSAVSDPGLAPPS